MASLLLPIIEADPEQDPGDPSRSTQLQIEGHPNFAHQLLNGYTALESAISTLGSSLGPIQLVGLAPFAPMENIFPEVQWATPWNSAEKQYGACFELPVSQRPQGIAGTLRQRIRRACSSVMSTEGKNLARQLDHWRATGGWVLWLSVKAGTAKAAGLTGLVYAWLQELHRRGFASPLLLVEGFSLQAGHKMDDCVQGMEIRTLIEEERRQAAHILDAVREFEFSIPSLAAIGFSLADSVAIGERADFYFCHQGTVQHKLGWLQDGVPGVVHSNSQRNMGDFHPWGAMGNFPVPRWFPAKFCEDLQEGPRGCYRFRHATITRAAEWLCDQLESSLIDRELRLPST